MTQHRGPLENQLVDALKQEMQHTPDPEVFREVGARLGIALMPDVSSLAQGVSHQSAAGAAGAGTATSAATTSAWFLHPVSIFLTSVAVGTTALIGLAPGEAPKAASNTSASIATVASSKVVHAPRSSAPLPDSAASEPVEATPGPDASTLVARTAPRTANAAVPVASAPTTASLSAQQTLLDTARRALARGDHAAALEALSWHRAQFARTALAEERDALTVKALRAAGRSGEAEAAAVRFARLYPRSVFLAGMGGASPNP